MTVIENTNIDIEKNKQYKFYFVICINYIIQFLEFWGIIYLINYLINYLFDYIYCSLSVTPSTNRGHVASESLSTSRQTQTPSSREFFLVKAMYGTLPWEHFDQLWVRRRRPRRVRLVFAFILSWIVSLLEDILLSLTRCSMTYAAKQ